MECWPERLRPLLAGAIGAAANVGFLLVGWVGKLFPVTPESWRWMFLIGGLPAFLVFFIRLFVPESERWKMSVSQRVSSPLREIFAAGFLKNTLLAIAFSSIAPDWYLGFRSVDTTMGRPDHGRQNTPGQGGDSDGFSLWSHRWVLVGTAHWRQDRSTSHILRPLSRIAFSPVLSCFVPCQSTIVYSL